MPDQVRCSQSQTWYSQKTPFDSAGYLYPHFGNLHLPAFPLLHLPLSQSSEKFKACQKRLTAARRMTHIFLSHLRRQEHLVLCFDLSVIGAKINHRSVRRGMPCHFLGILEGHTSVRCVRDRSPPESMWVYILDPCIPAQASQESLYPFF